MTIWTAVGAIAVVLGFLAADIWAVASLQRDIATNAEGLKGLADKHKTFTERVADDFKGLETYVEKRINELLDDRRRAPSSPPPASPRQQPH